jgi:thiol-disulfide isomerase/thioredoxin
MFTHVCASAQTPAGIIREVKKAQAGVKWIAYTMQRTDTLVTGDVRSMAGNVIMKPDNNVLGFLFHAQMDGLDEEKIYDGNMGYIIGRNERTYSSSPNNIRYLIDAGGSGWLVLPDLVKIDTSRAIAFNLLQDSAYYFLKMRYADYKPEDVINRYKILTISRKMLLPVAMRSHQETLGSVQDLYYHINDMHINDPSFSYDFSLPFLKDYQREIDRKAAVPPVFGLKNAPPFTLNSFADSTVQLADYKGKVVLLDFWEVWCGPCMAAMPKVQHLYDKGLQVLGIINDTRQLEAAKRMVKSRHYSFPMLVGNEQLKKDYQLDGSVPLYILLDRTGKIVFISPGYSGEMEAAIEQAIE